MSEYDALFKKLQKQKEQSERRNFNSFMSILDTELTKNLNKFYKEDRDKYATLITNMKAQGFKVLRNSAGEHKIRFM